MPGRDNLGFSYAVIYEQNQKDFTLLVVLRSSGLGTSDQNVTSYKMAHLNELDLLSRLYQLYEHIT